MGEIRTFSGTIMDRLIQNSFWTNESANARLPPMARPKEFDRDWALMHAIGVFTSHGYEGTSTEALLKAMDISRQSLYDTFGSKRKLYIEALRRYNLDSATGFVQNLEGGATSLEGLRRALVSHLERRNKLTNGSCLGVGAICEFGTRDPVIMAAGEEAAALLLESLVRALTRARASGEIPPDVDPRLAADFLLTTLNGLKINTRAGMPLRRLKEVASMALRALTHDSRQTGNSLSAEPVKRARRLARGK
jgi:TetR/AcrR family transcriptional regulator, transcriptional repressor for nem operon